MVLTEKEHVDPSTCRTEGCTIICHTARHSKTKSNETDKILVNTANKEKIASDTVKPRTNTTVSG